MTWCVYFTLMGSKGFEPEVVKKHCDELTLQAITRFVEEGWAEQASDLVMKLGIRYQDYKMEIEYEILGVDGANQHGGPHFGMANVYQKAYERSGTPRIMAMISAMPRIMAVSYTHLTLPTTVIV